MKWIENAYVKLTTEEIVRQTVPIAFEDGWIHIRGDDMNESFPASAVEFVRWPQRKPATGSVARFR